MREERVSLRGKLVRDMMKNMMDSAMGHKFQTGEYRMNPVEPAWICPSEYEYEIVEMEKFQMAWVEIIQLQQLLVSLHSRHQKLAQKLLL